MESKSLPDRLDEIAATAQDIIDTILESCDVRYFVVMRDLDDEIVDDVYDLVWSAIPDVSVLERKYGKNES